MAKQDDVLTGLPSGSAVYDGMREALTTGDGAALALLDIDRFMAINDELGADTGDRVLQALAALLTEEVAENGGTVFRVSGDEFALLLPGLTLEQAFLRLERFRARVDASAERFALPDGHRVTVTAGVAQFPRDAKDGPGLFKAADAALSSAKEQGRNAVGLPPNEEMVMKSCYYPAGAVRRLKALAERTRRKESDLLREGLTDLLRKFDAA
jgi:diguanylate cyclase (GGDEF)-like protein